MKKVLRVEKIGRKWLKVRESGEDVEKEVKWEWGYGKEEMIESWDKRIEN